MTLLFAEKSLEDSLPESQASAANVRSTSYTFAIPGLSQEDPLTHKVEMRLFLCHPAFSHFVSNRRGEVKQADFQLERAL